MPSLLRPVHNIDTSSCIVLRWVYAQQKILHSQLNFFLRPDTRKQCKEHHSIVEYIITLHQVLTHGWCNTMQALTLYYCEPAFNQTVNVMTKYTQTTVCGC